MVSFALTGPLVVLVMRMLGEMAAAYPAVGGFYEYNRLALGELAGFMTGWMYWYFWIIVVALEAVAGARLLGFWFPGVAPWVFTLGLMTLFTLLNLLSVRSWGETEYWFASIKVVAITLFLGIGAAAVTGFWPGVPGGVANLTAHGGFMPMGIAAGVHRRGGRDRLLFRLGDRHRGGGRIGRTGACDRARHAVGDLAGAGVLRRLAY